ncbi:MAG: hypothetical protein JWM11_503, partial [Planctomycetaceae bacterium]|nr:hypothetical protein [Planctomycetaceae bacterium]
MVEFTFAVSPDVPVPTRLPIVDY